MKKELPPSLARRIAYPLSACSTFIFMHEVLEIRPLTFFVDLLMLPEFFAVPLPYHLDTDTFYVLLFESVLNAYVYALPVFVLLYLIRKFYLIHSVPFLIFWGAATGIVSSYGDKILQFAVCA